MCGIAGGVGDGLFQTVYDNLHLLSRRGPDSQNVKRLNSRLIFASTRLALTDPHPRSNQPMVDIKTGNAIIFNGEIYNYLDLRKLLLLKGFEFETLSDTEVLLKLLTYIGIEAIKMLEGMFSFVFFDNRSKKIFMSRDYLGKKPLYYGFSGNKLFFGSQMNIMKKFIPSLELNQDSLQTYMKLGYLIDPLTMYRQINQVTPGEILEFDLNTLIKSKVFSFIPNSISNEINDDLRTIFKKELLTRTKGHEGDIALSLSGGTDSSIIALECAKQGIPIKCYSLGWKSPDKEKYNADAYRAREIAAKLKLDFQMVEMPSGSSALELIDDYIRAMGEPNSNPTGLSMMHLYSRIQKDGFRVVLTGDGADEIFGGYGRYNISNRISRFPQMMPTALNSLILKKSPRMDSLYKFLVALTPVDDYVYWYFFHSIIGDYHYKKLFGSYIYSKPDLLGLELRSIFGTNHNKTSSLMYQDLRTWLSMESNRKLDRVSMWHSIEARSPFQSEKIINFGYKHLKNTKHDLIPKSILLSTFPEINQLPLHENKYGFISPLGDWLRSNPELIYEATHNLPKYIEIRKEELVLLSNAPNRGNFTEIKLLWSLVILYKWFCIED